MKKVSPFSFVVAISVLIVALSVAYYLVIFIPAKEKTRQEQVNREFQLKEAEQQSKKIEQQVYKDCDTEAEENASKLLKSKIEIAQKAGTYIPPTWKEASEKGLHLKDDYSSYYDSCLRRHGIKY